MIKTSYSGSFTLFFVFALMLMCCSSANAVQQENAIAPEKLEFIVDKMEIEIAKIVRDHITIRIELLQSQFNLEEKALRKVKILAKGIAARQAREFETVLRERLARWIRLKDEVTFSINGTSYTFDGEEQQSTGFLSIEFTPNPTASRLAMRVRNGRSSIGGSVAHSQPLNFGELKSWKKSLDSIDDNLAAQFRVIDQAKKQDRLNTALTMVIADRIGLDQTQKSKLETWIVGKEIAVLPEKTIFEQLRTKMADKNLWEKVPEFLNADQVEAWQKLEYNPYPLGW